MWSFCYSLAESGVVGHEGAQPDCVVGVFDIFFIFCSYHLRQPHPGRVDISNTEVMLQLLVPAVCRYECTAVIL
jgi:hypothetical protein